jgi:hypothetical protein
MTVNLQIDLHGHFCNEWPLFEIYHDDKIIFDDQIRSHQKLVFDLSCNGLRSKLAFRHKGKRFGDDGIWDTDANGQDRYIEIQDIRFDAVSIGQEIMSKLWIDVEWDDSKKQNMDADFLQTYSRFLCHGKMNFNGAITLEFDLPVYNWLIINKYKIQSIENKSYFSQYQENWHYEPDIRLIKEIKELMKFD